MVAYCSVCVDFFDIRSEVAVELLEHRIFLAYRYGQQFQHHFNWGVLMDVDRRVDVGPSAIVPSWEGAAGNKKWICSVFAGHLKIRTATKIIFPPGREFLNVHRISSDYQCPPRGIS